MFVLDVPVRDIHLKRYLCPVVGSINHPQRTTDKRHKQIVRQRISMKLKLTAYVFPKVDEQYLSPESVILSFVFR